MRTPRRIGDGFLKGLTMDGTKLTRNQRRQIDKLAPHTDRILVADVAFFEQHPDRRYRVRRANDAEIAQAEILEDKLLQAPQGWCWFAIVKKVPGAYLRMFVANDPTVETGLDAPDDLAKWIWEEAPPDVIQIGDVVTAVADRAMATSRPAKITFSARVAEDGVTGQPGSWAGAMKLTRTQRHQIEKLASHFDRITQADRAFFEQHPDRKHRLRLASEGEIADSEFLSGKVESLPPRFCHFVIVRKISPRFRLRMFVTGPEDTETDIEEVVAQKYFDACATPQARELEATTLRRAALSKEGGAA
jgi:Spy/CpxP family protein refolding chaperone